MTIRFIKAIF